MKKMHDNNNGLLENDPDFIIEEIGTGDRHDQKKERSGADEEKERKAPFFIRGWKIVFLALLLCLLIVLLGSAKKKEENDAPPLEETSQERISVTEKEEPEEMPVTEKAESTAQTEKPKEEETKEEKPAEDLTWQKVIFGDYESGVVSYPISILGLTENEKNLTHFRESDFVKSLSSFLSMNNIKTSAVTFTGSVACSAPSACAYTAQMKGVSDRSLTVLFFPGYPGKYLFTLEDVKAGEEANSQKQTDASKPVQSAESLVAPQQTPAAAPKQTENSYDAMRLNLSGISQELGNYLANPYELQYGLYDYLYNKGITSADSASVRSYYIDSEDRLATIEIDVDKVGSVTAIYDPGTNEYSYQ